MHEVVDQEGRSPLLRAGDPDSWEAFYRGIYPAMFAYAQRRLGDVDDARDAVAEAMTRAVGSQDRLSGASSPEAWCFGILRHVVVDAQRRTYRRRGLAVRHDPGDEPPDEQVLLEHDHDAVRTAFARLDIRDRDLLELRVVAGLSSEDVAAILRMRPGAVRTAQARALGRLRHLLQKDM